MADHQIPVRALELLFFLIMAIHETCRKGVAQFKVICSSLTTLPESMQLPAIKSPLLMLRVEVVMLSAFICASLPNSALLGFRMKTCPLGLRFQRI